MIFDPTVRARSMQNMRRSMRSFLGPGERPPHGGAVPRELPANYGDDRGAADSFGGNRRRGDHGHGDRDRARRAFDPRRLDGQEPGSLATRGGDCGGGAGSDPAVWGAGLAAAANRLHPRRRRTWRLRPRAGIDRREAAGQAGPLRPDQTAPGRPRDPGHEHQHDPHRAGWPRAWPLQADSADCISAIRSACVPWSR